MYLIVFLSNKLDLNQATHFTIISLIYFGQKIVQLNYYNEVSKTLLIFHLKNNFLKMQLQNLILTFQNVTDHK